MKLLTEKTSPPCSVRGEGGDALHIAVLDSDVCRDMRWCVNCAGEQIFVEVYEFDGGRVGCCLGCGDERVIRFTRMNSEVA
jgi:hypothetical protein